MMMAPTNEIVYDVPLYILYQFLSRLISSLTIKDTVQTIVARTSCHFLIFMLICSSTATITIVNHIYQGGGGEESMKL
jgi:hypothetical protein